MALLLWGGAVSCQSKEESSPVQQEASAAVVNKNVNVQDFAALVSEGTGLLLDVRTDREFEMGHIKGAAQIDFYDAGFQEELAKLDKAVPVYVYCRSGNRSGQAAQMMKQMGFKEVYNLEGGIGAWARSQPIEK
jgi:rhodanese-related sulfurtransferase